MIHTARLVLLLLVSLPLLAQTPPPQESWENLKKGNRVFEVGPDLTFKDVVGKRNQKQKPRIAIVTCADSRVGPELVFHQNLLDIFVIRVAGNVVDDFAIASLEYAASPKNNWLDLIVVVGHSECGAVEAALHPGDPGTPSLRTLVGRIRESFHGIPYTDDPPDEVLEEAVKANAKNVANYITAHSDLLRDAVLRKKIVVMAAYYDMRFGKVHPLK